MSTRIGLLSDVHAMAAPVREALAIFEREGVEQILCPGDVAGYGNEVDECVRLLQESGAQVTVGNHDRWCVERGEGNEETLGYLDGLPPAINLNIAERQIYMVHASPPESDMEGIKLLDEYGELLSQEVDYWRGRLVGFGHDVLVVGHTHQVYAEQLGETLVVNPGSTAFNHSCAILHLPECRVEWHALEGGISRIWNWGEMVREGQP